MTSKNELSQNHRQIVSEQRASPCSARDLALCSTDAARITIPYKTALKLQVLPLGLITIGRQKFLHIAASRNASIDLTQALRFASGYPIRLLHVEESTLGEAIFIAYRGDEKVLRSNLSQVQSSYRTQKLDQTALLEHEPTGDIAKFLSELLEYSLAHSASDIHLIPKQNQCLIRVRVDGELLQHRLQECSSTVHEQFVNRIKVLAKLKHHLHAVPQDGAFEVQLPSTPLCTRKIRVSLLPTTYGEKVVLRLPGLPQIPKVRELGFSPFTEQRLNFITARAEGALLFCGPTGSGKTTSMYSIVEPLTQTKNVVTIENPVEYELENASQTSVDSTAGLTFSSCLISTLRQDPDVILVGEIRDRESASAALQAAFTGHLVLSTVHARNVFEAFLRLKTLGVDPLSIAQGISGIICQRLTPKLCQKCRVVDLRSSRELSSTVYQANGCPACDYTGYSGRILLEESLFCTGKLTEALRAGELDPEQLKLSLNEQNYYSASRSLEGKIKGGDIDVATAKRIVGGAVL